MKCRQLVLKDRSCLFILQYIHLLMFILEYVHLFIGGGETKVEMRHTCIAELKEETSPIVAHNSNRNDVEKNIESKS